MHPGDAGSSASGAAWRVHPATATGPAHPIAKVFPSASRSSSASSSPPGLDSVPVMTHQVRSHGQLRPLVDGRLVSVEVRFFGEVPTFPALRHPQRPGLARKGPYTDSTVDPHGSGT